jgi:hypothetical protein
LTRFKSIIVFGDTQPWDQQRELLLAHPITNGFAQLATPSFLTSWIGMGDIFEYDKRWRISRVVIRNSRTYFGTYDVKGFNALQIGKQSKRLGQYLSRNLIAPLFTNHFPGVFSMSVDRRTSKNRIMAIADQAPAPIEIVPPRELRTILNQISI